MAGAALIVLAVLLKRRRAAKQKMADAPSVPPAPARDNREEGRGQPQDAQPHVSAILALGSASGESAALEHNASPTRGKPAEADETDHGDIMPPSAPAPRAGVEQSRTEHAEHAAQDQPPSHRRNALPNQYTPPAGADGIDGAGIVRVSTEAPPTGPARLSTRHAAIAIEGSHHAGLAGEDAARYSPETSRKTTVSTATASTANVSTHERAEIAQFLQGQAAGNSAAPVASSGPQSEEPSCDASRAPSAAGRQSLAGDIGLGHAVLAAAEELVRHCQVPGIGEAAAAVRIMADLVADSRENDKASDARLRQCRSIVMALRRAARVADKVS